MNLIAALLLFIGLAPLPAVAAPHQTLSIVLHANDASTMQLPHYRMSAPISVRVAGDASRYDAVTVTAHGPDGLAIREPLARTPEGFQGAVRLVQPGAWTIGLNAQLGPVSDAIAGIPLDVVAPDGVEAAGYAGMLLATLMFVAGVLLVVRRDLRARAYALIDARKRS